MNRAALWLLVVLFTVAGVGHFVRPRLFEAIVPTWLPNARLLVQISGLAELLGAIGLALPATRYAAGCGLIVLLVAVFPANVQMLLLARAAGASALWQTALWLRLPLQPVLVWLVWWTAIASKARVG
ncbi:MAG TPA: hypothetical protein VK636_22085 [Gemmatimonadaceae bacterium]|nr:hypothetical protein [Gemmatimonadaceae bacterium]